MRVGPRRQAPVVMVHGLFTGSVASWMLTCAAALSPRHDVFLYDLRGHGTSERPARGYDVATMVADLDALTGDLPPFALVGHGYGAQIALRFALAYPDRVRQLVLVEPPLAAAAESDSPRLVGNDDFDADLWLKTFGADAEPHLARSRNRNRVARRHVDNLVRNTTILDDVRQERPITDADLRNVTQELLVMFGSQSPFFPAAERVARIRPEARCVVLAGSHALHLDAADELRTELTHFLAPAAQAAIEAIDDLVIDLREATALATFDDHELELELELLEVPYG